MTVANRTTAHAGGLFNFGQSFVNDDLTLASRSFHAISRYLSHHIFGVAWPHFTHPLASPGAV